MFTRVHHNAMCTIRTLEALNEKTTHEDTSLPKIIHKSHNFLTLKMIL